MGESWKFQKSFNFEIQILKHALCLQRIHNFKFKWSLPLDELKIHQRSYQNLPNSAFWESQPQNPEFRNNPDNFHPCDDFT